MIELILVMALLIMVISLVTPQLSQFFGNRDLDAEVRRFVALTRYGQSRAVSEGVPMLLWVDAKARRYGLQQETGYTDGDTRAQEFTLAESLSIGVDNATTKPPAPGKKIGIRFLPEGNVSATGSVAGIFLQQGKEPAVWIVPSPDRLTYEVQNQNSPVANARR